jgi:hypothetical protein
MLNYVSDSLLIALEMAGDLGDVVDYVELRS